MSSVVRAGLLQEALLPEGLEGFGQLGIETRG
jgi:hypothetical protein